MSKPNYFDTSVAQRYDTPGEGMFAPEVLSPTVEFLAALTGDEPALEFAIGTGRVAFPLSERGVEVYGIEFSAAMAEQLRAKPGSERIPVTIGDMSETRVKGAFALVYLVFNTIMNLTTQEEQVACFQNAAAHLLPGGYFVIETMVPMLRQLSPGARTVVFTSTPDYLGFDEYTDFVAQISYSHHWTLEDGKGRKSSAPFRYVWPSELDLMARVAGMTLVERWADWNRAPFTDDSPSHVSVWQKS